MTLENNSALPARYERSAVNPFHADDLLITANAITSCTDQTPIAITEPWTEFRKLFAKPVRFGRIKLNDYLSADKTTQKREKDGPGWIPASLLDQSKGRNQTNIDNLFFVVLDIDQGIAFDDARYRLDGYEAIIHTTYSHTPASPKLRVILPLRHPVKPAQATGLFNLMNAKFDHKLDTACMEPARLFYLPSCPPDATEHFQVVHLHGRFFDLSEVAPKSTHMTVAASNPSLASRPSRADIALATSEGTTVGGRNNKLAELVGACIAKGIDADQSLRVVQLWNTKLSTPLSDHEVKRTVLSVFKTAKRKSDLAEIELEKVIKTMNDSYAFLHNTSRIVRLEDRSIQSKEMMRDRYANATVLVGDGDRSKRVTHYQAWLESQQRREHIGFTFAPGKDLIIDNHVNQWTAWGANPAPGDITPWKTLLDFLFGSGTSERQWIEQWIAYPLQHPGAKLTTAVVIWSPHQGIGKSLLGETISRLYGRHAKTITATELHDKNNSWSADTLFVLGEENSSGDRRSDSNRLKHLITGDTMFVHEKYMVSYEAPNMLNFMFTSNHPDAFHLEIRDRRYFVWSIDAQPKPASFYEAIVKWRDSTTGIAALMHHLQNVDLTGFDPFGHAPQTKAKFEMVEQSKTEVERWITDALTDDYIDNHLGAEIVSLNDLLARHHHEVGSSKTNSTALGKALRRQIGYELRRITIGKNRIKMLPLRRNDFWTIQGNSEWATEFLKGRSKSSSTMTSM